jgi:hypothetical protein
MKIVRRRRSEVHRWVTHRLNNHSGPMKSCLGHGCSFRESKYAALFETETFYASQPTTHWPDIGARLAWEDV